MLEFSDSLNRRPGRRTRHFILALRERLIPLILEGVAEGRGSDVNVSAKPFLGEELSLTHPNGWPKAGVVT